MKREDCKRFMGIKVKLVLKTAVSYQYTGYIKEVREDSILFRDKFNQLIPIDISSIAVINPINNGGDL